MQKVNARLFVGLSIALLWIAGAAVVGAAENALDPAWPLAMGFLAVFVRFFIAPVPLHMYACAAAAVVTCLAAAAFAYISGGSLLEVGLLEAGHPWARALLALGYGVMSGVVIAAVLARALEREVDDEVESLLAKTDNTTFGLTWRRNTHPVLIVLAIGIVIALVGFIRGWWLG